MFPLASCVLTFAIFIAVFSDEHSMNGTVFFNEQTMQYSIKLGVIDCVNGITCGYFNDSLNKTGWSTLEIKSAYKLSSAHTTDYNRMYATGLLEGYLSAYEIYWGYYTGWQGMQHIFKEFQLALTNWTETQHKWMKQQIHQNALFDPYWNYVNLLSAQYDGQQYGYNLAATDFKDIPPLNDFVFQFISGNQDLVGVIIKIILEDRTLSLHQKKEKLDEIEALNDNSRCSALIKVTPKLDNIFISHSTWSNYFWSNRVYKHYMIQTNASIPMQHYTMSSYPGSLSSIDDFYIMDSGLAVTETTNGVFNIELYTKLKPQTLFTWQRARVANAISSCSETWVRTFARHNSGTYNNQWMVLNYNMFEVNKPLKDGMLWIAEQIPGNVSFMDATDILRRGYWSSYNVPAIEHIYKESGFEAKAKIEGVQYSYDLAPRARITRRDANKCNNITMVKKLMRYNNYKYDPLQDKNPTWAMMNRADLLSGDDAKAFGGIDTKIADLEMMKSVTSIACGGPTHDDLPPFIWNTSQWNNEPHTGLPEVYDFKWISMEPMLV